MRLNLERLDRTVSSVTTFADAEQEDRAFWHSRTPEERLMYVEGCVKGTGAMIPLPQDFSEFLQSLNDQQVRYLRAAS